MKGKSIFEFVFSFPFSEKSAFEYGLVNHALCAAMRSLIKVKAVALSLHVV